jgi:hypothetical protein
MIRFKSLFKNITFEDIFLNIAFILLLPFMLAVVIGFAIGNVMTKILTYVMNILQL